MTVYKRCHLKIFIGQRLNNLSSGWEGCSPSLLSNLKGKSVI
uniref:Uncharacterized protein n=1 Tax=Anguilla anguilla TaxID=7936 RepID=A0A0E9QRX1_ANGAN